MGGSSSRPRPSQHQHGAQPGNQAYAPPNFAGYSNGQFYGGMMPQQQFPPPGPHYGPPGGFQQPTHTPGHYGQPPPRPPPVATHEYHQTATIKNQVNLKKATLALVPQPGRPDELAVEFALDATAPCRVTTFLLATEDPKNSCALATLNTPKPPVHYQAGMGLRFPPAGGEPHIINVSAHALADLTTAYTDSFPLVVRIEALPEAAAREGHSLDELPPGAPLPLWVQAQTTYAKLARDEEGRWRVQVVKQKIWVKGVSYELQEIYGMEASGLTKAGPGGGGAAGMATGTAAGVVMGQALGELPEGRECVICLSAERDTTVLPCRHMCMCQECAAALKTQTNKCPVCRADIESLLHIKIQRKQPAGAGTGAGASSSAAT